MLLAMMLMIFLSSPADTNGKIQVCDTITGTTLTWSSFNNCSDVKLSDKGINNVVTNKESRYNKLIKLDISYNNLSVLPEGFLSDAFVLQKVHLEGNNLQHLPEMFLSKSSNLQFLGLEGNPLSEIPRSVFRESLVNLTVDCRCDLVGNIITHLNGNATKHSMCNMASERINLKVFYEENCGQQYLALYIVLPILAIGLIGGSVALYIWKRKRTSTSLENKGSTDKSPTHGQPRYMSRSMEGPAATLGPGQRQDYENVFVGHLQTTETKPYGYLENEREPGAHSRKHVAEEDIYLESDVNEGDQPIYTNTHGLYYNYSEPIPTHSKNKEEDDVYILPDH